MKHNYRRDEDLFDSDVQRKSVIKEKKHGAEKIRKLSKCFCA